MEISEQRWRELNEREGLEADAEVALFLLDRWVTVILLCFYTTYLCWVLFEYAWVSSSLVSAIVIMPGLCTYVWGGDIKIGARSCWAMGVFVLVLSNINIVWQKSLSAPLSAQETISREFRIKIITWYSKQLHSSYTQILYLKSMFVIRQNCFYCYLWVFQNIYFYKHSSHFLHQIRWIFSLFSSQCIMGSPSL